MSKLEFCIIKKAPWSKKEKLHICPLCGGISEEMIRQKHKDNCELAAALNAPSEGQKRE